MSGEGATFFILIVAIFGVALVWSIGQGQRRRAAWRSIAATLGFSYHEPMGLMGFTQPGILHGEASGFKVVIDTEQRGSGDSSETWTRVRVEHGARLGLGLSVRPEGSMDFLGKMLGGQDIEIGDAPFDRAMRIRGYNEERVIRLLGATVRQDFTALAARKGEVELNDACVQWAQRGVAEHAHVLREVIEDAERVAAAVVEAHNAEAARRHVGAPVAAEIQRG